MKISSDFKEVIKISVLTLGIFLAPVLMLDFSKLYINIFLYLVVNIILSSIIVMLNKSVEKNVERLNKSVERLIKK